jgi:hypothetical protein
MDETTTAMTLTHGDVRHFLLCFAASIELDQIRVDALPPETFHHAYDANIWRGFRGGHLDFVARLLPTVNAMSSTQLQELARLAITYETAVVRTVMLDLFVEAAMGTCAPEEFEGAAQFFGWLIKDMDRIPPCKDPNGDAKILMMQWLPEADPLRIAEDPECGYGLVSYSMN